MTSVKFISIVTKHLTKKKIYSINSKSRKNTIKNNLLWDKEANSYN